MLWCVLMLMLPGFALPGPQPDGENLAGLVRSALITRSESEVAATKVVGAPLWLARWQRMRPPVDVTAKTAGSNGTLRTTRQLDLKRNTADAIDLAMTSSAQLCLSQTAESVTLGSVPTSLELQASRRGREFCSTEV